MKSLIWSRNFQGSIELREWHGYCWSIFLCVCVRVCGFDCDNQEQKAEQSHLENMDLKSESKTTAKDPVVVKESAAIEERVALKWQ